MKTTTLSPADALRATYGKEIVDAVARRSETIYREIPLGHACRLCGKEITKRNQWARDTSTSFALVSHGEMHVRKGEAYNVFYGVNGYVPMPIEAEVIAEVARRKEFADTERPLAALKAALRPLVQEKRSVETLRDISERWLVRMVRADGAATQHMLEAIECMAEIQHLQVEIQRLHAAIDTVQTKYSQAVLDRLTVGDFS